MIAELYVIAGPLVTLRDASDQAAQFEPVG
jgi:hypothetical protein